MAKFVNYKGRKCWKCNSEHTRIRLSGGPVWFKRYIKELPTNEYECYYCYNKLKNPNIEDDINGVSICGFYKRHTIIDGKPRLIVVNENGDIINKNPTKEELKNLQTEQYTINTNSRKYTKDQLLNYLKQFYEENGRAPTTKDFKSDMYPDFSTYKKHFGSWNNALKLVGMDLDTLVGQGKLENESQKGRWGEILVIRHFENNSIDLSGKNSKSPYDGISPDGMNYDAKSSKLDKYLLRWKYDICNIYKEEIEIFYFLAFNENYTELLHIWRVPADIIDGNYFSIGIRNNYTHNVENMKEFEIMIKQ